MATSTQEGVSAERPENYLLGTKAMIHDVRHRAKALNPH